MPPALSKTPHGGYEERGEFSQSEFCAPCHQFFDEAGPNGKPIENTFVEWRASPQAAAGRTCQSCHMPDRAHLWRGIHDAEMVRNAVAVELAPIELGADVLRAALVVENRDVGHMFPTYVTPRIFVALWQVNATGEEIPGTRVEAPIGREVDFGTWTEIFDTRIAPGESVKLDYALPRHAEARALAGSVTVDPDYHYKGVYESLLATLTNPEARALIEEANRRAAAASFLLATVRHDLPD